MKHILVYILIIVTCNVFSQDDEKQQLKTLEQAKNLIYEGNELASNDNYINAEMEYRKAISKDPNLAVGNYNLANSYYEKGKLDEAFYRLQQAAKVAKTKEEKHKAYHNIGNVLMQNKKCKEAAEAFKNALRNNPSDEETRYNFALAKQCAEEQEEQQEQEDQEDENKDQNDQNDENKDQDDNKEEEKENEDEKKEDQKDEGEQDKKEGEDEKDEKEDPKDEKEKDGNEENKEQDKKKPQPKPGQLSPQQIKNLLEAMNNQEEKVQEKINAEKTKGAKTKSDKDW